ncbi:MAG: Serine/threonine protein kinase PrkC, regulator of stationary phase [Myxococcaceae bacterium]|nr:Serine/threonine protein kinase PrkC, regulator of stationary phase [Myxococcaceae bacterium]
MFFDGRYKVERELGRGAMGVVYLARDVELDRLVALKVMSATARDAVALGRFKREARALATLRHENVVQVYGAGRHAGDVYFAMEYIDGETLEDILVEHGAHGARVPLFRTLTLLRRVASGLDNAHAAGLVHRDVKPSNVVVETATGRPVLVDFGVVLAPHLGDESQCAGTPLYMAPEQIAGEPTTARTDQYSLACVAFELLTGTPPFDDDRLVQIFRMHLAVAPPLASQRSKLPAAVDGVLVRGLAKNPADRYASCGELIAALDAAMGNFVLDTRTVPPPVARQASTRNILIVERDAQVSAAIAVALERAGGTRCSIAASPEAAIAQAHALVPDLVLLDLDLPGVGAVEMLARLRELDGAAPVVVGMCSAEPAARWRYSVLGVSKFVERSLRPLFLAQMVLDVLSGGAATVPPPDESFAWEVSTGLREILPTSLVEAPPNARAKAR